MQATNTLPKKLERNTCTECGLMAPGPVVVATGEKREPCPAPPPPGHAPRPTIYFGRCANRKACELRQLRAANAQKRATTCG